MNFHSSEMTNDLSFVKTNDHHCFKTLCRASISHMMQDTKPFSDIAERLKWHRQLEGLTQKEYAAKINQKRPALNNWESGDYRLSLDGALAIRRTFGLSLDFIYEGNDEALSITLRAAWRDRPLVNFSK